MIAQEAYRAYRPDYLWLFFPPHQQLRQISAAIAPSSHFLPAGDSKWWAGTSPYQNWCGDLHRVITCNNIFLSGWKWFHPSQIGSEIQFGVKTGVYHCTLQPKQGPKSKLNLLLVLLPWQPNYPDLQKNLPKSPKISIFQHQPSANGSSPFQHRSRDGPSVPLPKWLRWRISAAVRWCWSSPAAAPSAAPCPHPQMAEVTVRKTGDFNGPKQ